MKKLKLLKNKLLYKLASRLIERSPVCERCGGHGFIHNVMNLDNITSQEFNTPCLLCGQIGHHPLSRFTKLVISLMPD